MSFISDSVRVRRDLRQSIRQLGESLGCTPGSVASNLAAVRVVGKPNHSNDCAIARYLQAIVGTEQSVKTISVSDRSVRVTLNGNRLALRVRLPKPVAKFIQAFDSGCYPNLVDPTHTPATPSAASTVGPNPAA